MTRLTGDIALVAVQMRDGQTLARGSKLTFGE